MQFHENRHEAFTLLKLFHNLFATNFVEIIIELLLAKFMFMHNLVLIEILK